MATIVQVPTVAIVTVTPDTLQTPGVLELKLTGKPEVAVTLLIVNGATPSVCVSGNTKPLMICDTNELTLIETGVEVALMPKLLVAVAVRL